MDQSFCSCQLQLLINLAGVFSVSVDMFGFYLINKYSYMTMFYASYYKLIIFKQLCTCSIHPH